MCRKSTKQPATIIKKLKRKYNYASGFDTDASDVPVAEFWRKKPSYNKKQSDKHKMMRDNDGNQKKRGKKVNKKKTITKAAEKKTNFRYNKEYKRKEVEGNSTGSQKKLRQTRNGVKAQGEKQLIQRCCTK